jgi:hypothetical protein
LRKFGTFRYRKPPGNETDLNKIESSHGILLKQAQKIEKEY